MPGKKPLDLTGQVFGKWTVLRSGRVTIHKGGTKHFWVCRCECGAEKEVPTSALRRGDSTKCMTCHRCLPDGEAAVNQRIHVYKRSAMIRKLSWSLTRETCKELFSSNCVYCGDPPLAYFKPTNCPTGFVFNGIDRVDNSRGYEPDNCVPCCFICNTMKMDRAVEEFLAHCKKIVRQEGVPNA